MKISPDACFSDCDCVTVSACRTRNGTNGCTVCACRLPTAKCWATRVRRTAPRRPRWPCSEPSGCSCDARTPRCYRTCASPSRDALHGTSCSDWNNSYNSNSSRRPPRATLEPCEDRLRTRARHSVTHSAASVTRLLRLLLLMHVPTPLSIRTTMTKERDTSSALEDSMTTTTSRCWARPLHLRLLDADRHRTSPCSMRTRASCVFVALASSNSNAIRAPTHTRPQLLRHRSHRLQQLRLQPRADSASSNNSSSSTSSERHNKTPRRRPVRS